MNKYKTLTNRFGKKIDIYLKDTGEGAYIVAIPENMADNVQMFVESYNSGGNSKDTYQENIDSATSSNGNAIEKNFMDFITDFPIVIPITPDLKKMPDFQQLSYESVKDYGIHEKFLKILEDVKKEIKDTTGKKVQDKIFLHGYSASGVFAQRFALIHPEIIDRCLIGGAVGTIPLPTKKLDYPLGIGDYETLFGKKFDFNSYKLIQFGYYVGEYEEKDIGNWNQFGESYNGKSGEQRMPMHDMSYQKITTPFNVGMKYRKLIGNSLNDRYKNSIGLNKLLGIDIEGIVVKDIDHLHIFDSRYSKNVEGLRNQFIAFYSQRKQLNPKDSSCCDRMYDMKDGLKKCVYKFAKIARIDDKKMCDDLICRLANQNINDSIDQILVSVDDLINRGVISAEQALSNSDLILELNPQDYKTSDDLIKRLEWIKSMNMEHPQMPLSENHKLVTEVFDKFNELIGTEFDCFYTGGLMGYLETNHKLERYHSDLDLFINEEQLLELYELISQSEDFEFFDNIKNKKENGHEFKIYYKGTQMSVGLFLFSRLPNNEMVLKEYFYPNKDKDTGLIVNENHLLENYARMTFSEMPREHNGIPYRAQSLEGIYSAKKDSRPKDKYDAGIIQDYVDMDIVHKIDVESKKNYFVRKTADEKTIVEELDEIINSRDNYRR